MNFFVRKDSQGKYRWLGSHTNSFSDLDDEILSSASHTEFQKALDDGFPLPMLLLCHEEKWKIGYTDLFVVDEVSPGQVFVVASGGFNEGMDEVAERLSGIPATMSHGFLALKTGEYDGKRTIDIYRTIEISALPEGVSMPANPLTYYYVAEDKMGIKDSMKRIRLAELFGEEVVAGIEEANKDIAQKAVADQSLVFKDTEEVDDVSDVQADAAGTTEVASDAAETVESTETETAETEAAPAAAPEYVTPNDLLEFGELIGGLFKEFSDGIGKTMATQAAAIEELAIKVNSNSESFKSLGDELTSIKKERDTPAAARPAYNALISAMSNQSEDMKTGQKATSVKENKTTTTRSNATGAIGFIQAILETDDANA